MTRYAKYAALTLLPFVLPAPAGQAQSLPAETGAPAPGVGFSLPHIGGSLNYAVNASELISNGFYNNSGVGATTDFSGDVAYISKSQFHPFSAVYDGGLLLANSGQPTTFFQSLSFSQVLSTKKWNIIVSDGVSYLPESPVSGLSGIPGVGDVGVDPISVGPAAGIGILTTYGPRVSNTVSGSASRILTGRISAQASGVYAIQRFIGDNSGLGLNSTNEGGSGGLTYRLSARDSLSGNYNYSSFSYSGNGYGFSAQGGTIGYSRQWSGRLGTSVFFGPQVIGGSNLAINGTSVQLSGGATANYQSRMTNYTLAYSRGVNNGSGVINGAFSDNITLAAHRQFGRNWAVSGDVDFSRSVSLPNFDLYSFDGNSVSFSGQATRGLGRYFSTYLSYTLERQSTSGSGTAFAAANAFSGVYQVVGIGISYSPRNILLNK
ncbi:MAG TPA: hypothetical protein VKV02_13585 [Acidobacteriaceae bacterium]|nr:hypothetical protein [Acidobacteriaceae bacterium]